MPETVRLEGFRELNRALADLKKSTERSILRRVAIRALEPIQERAKALAPVDEGRLRDSIVIGTNLTRGARAAERDVPKDGVRMYLGSASRNAVPREYGSARIIGGQLHISPGNRFLTSAWFGMERQTLNQVMDDLWSSVRKAAQRAEKRKFR